jgi:LysM repeat protein
MKDGFARLLASQRPSSRDSRRIDRFLKRIRLSSIRPRQAAIGGLSLAAIAGIVYLVAFSVTAPAVPPGTEFDRQALASVTIDAAPSSSAAPSAPTAVPAGSGLSDSSIDRTKDLDYIIRPGETLSEIAYSYGINYRVLSDYNRIRDVHLIRAGEKIVIPSLVNEAARAKQLKNVKETATPASFGPVKPVSISSERFFDGRVTTVRFKIDDPAADNLQDIVWDLGDGHRSFRSDPSYEYIEPRTYSVTLNARDKKGNAYRSKPLYIDIPQPQTNAEGLECRYYTLSSLTDLFKVEGSLVNVWGYDSIDKAPLKVVEEDETFTTIEFKSAGYYGLTLGGEKGQSYASVFVSPIASIHSDREDINWYKTQYNTGTSSNCGPASAAMGISYATGKDYPVIQVRQAIGWKGDGSTSFEELVAAMKKQSVNATIRRVSSQDDIRDAIDRGSVVIVLIQTGVLPAVQQRPDKNLFGKYYNDSVGHYIVIKGYSLDEQAFVVYDAIPSDWSGNSMRYGDRVSMIGRNRYYSSRSIMEGLRRYDMIEVTKGASE